MKGYAWPGVALVAVLGSLALGLLALTDLRSGEVLGIIGVLAGIGGGAALAQARDGAVESKVEAALAETQKQTPVINTMAKRVNGELDDRIASAVDQGNADLIRLLREHGVIGGGR